MATIASLVVDLEARTANLERQLQQAQRANRRYVNNARRQYSQLGGTLTNLRSIAAATFATLGASSLVRTVDSVTNINNLLRASGVAAEDLGNTFALVQEIANDTRSSFDATGRLFAVINRNAEALGATTSEIAVFTRAVQQGYAISGASAQEAAGATRQLSQALASGVLRGQELNSVMEQAPVIAQSIARELNIGLGELRTLAAEGRITSDVVFQAILNQSGTINDSFRTTRATFGQIATVVGNRVAPALAAIAQSVIPIVQGFANWLVVSTNLAAVLGAIATVLTLVVGRIVLASTQALVTAFISLAGAIAAATFSAAALIPIFSGVVLLVAAIGVGSAVFQTVQNSIDGATESASRLEDALSDVANNSSLGSTALDELRQSAASAGDSLNDLFNRLNPTRAAFQQYTMDLDTLHDALADGIISNTTYEQAIAALREEFEGTAEEITPFQQALMDAANTADEMGQVAVDAFDGMTNALTDFVTSGRTSFRDFAADIIRDIIRIQLRAAASNIFSSFFGGGGGLNVPGRQFGGPVAANRPYIVGEAGPELFVPSQAGSIVPNNELGGGTNITINAVDAPSVERLLTGQDPRLFFNLAEVGRRQSGL